MTRDEIRKLAEITYDAARKLGMREVVKLVEYYKVPLQPREGYLLVIIPLDIWQAKLKELREQSSGR